MDANTIALPLDWQEQDFSAIRTDDGHAYSPHTVRGPVAGPFGVYKGCYAVPHDPTRERNVFTLCHVPTGRNLCTLPRVRDCKALAEELAALPLRWHDQDPEQVIGSEEASAPFRAIVSRYRRAALPERLRDIDTPEHLR
jgi:hypothetical protein